MLSALMQVFLAITPGTVLMAGLLLLIMGGVSSFFAAQDMVKRHRAEAQLKRSLSLLQATLESTTDGILVVSQKRQIELYNQKFTEMWRIPPENMVLDIANQPLLDLVLEQLTDPAQFLAKVQMLYKQPESTSYDVLEFKDGRVFERYSQPQRLNGTIVGRVWSFRDVTERYRDEAIIRYQALHDLLTGLPNRTLFGDRLTTALSHAAHNQSQLAVMFLDLDRFKHINDTSGHAVGDQLLKSVAQRLTHCLRQSDTVSRWGGDEFTVLLADIHSVEEATTIAQRMLDSLRAPFNLDGYDLQISSSIGIAIFSSDGEDAETLLKNADIALYRAKDAGRNGYFLYSGASSTWAYKFQPSASAI